MLKEAGFEQNVHEDIDTETKRRLGKIVREKL